MADSEWVRVKDPSTKHEYTVHREAVVDGHEVLKKEAIDANGNPLPDKPHITVAQKKAISQEESA